MPELPEVEVTKQGIKPYIINKKLTRVKLYQQQLRWQIPDSIQQVVENTLLNVTRRAKYILLDFSSDIVLIHLGMSGTLRIAAELQLKKHDHVVFSFNRQVHLIYNDPRKFGCVLHFPKSQLHTFKLLINLAPEPLTDTFNAEYLFKNLQKRKKGIKLCLMDQNIVVGVGNIYANEVLFATKIHPQQAANAISLAGCAAIVTAIKRVLKQAITAGGTTLKDFTQSDGKPGYFANKLNIYGRSGKSCLVCDQQISLIKIAGRATYFCGSCQN